jgi:hypothetical protein
VRTYIRVYNQQGAARWVTVQTDAEGFDDYVWASTLIQCFKLNINESPFFSNYGLPSVQAVLQQIAPDSYVANLQTLFAGYFASLVVSRQASNPPTYRANVTFQNGVQLQLAQLDGEKAYLYAVTDTGQPGVDDSGQQIIVG